MANKEHLTILKQGVEVWNEWRRKNREIKPDLRGADLRKVDLKEADFIEADIRSTNFTGANLKGANFTGAKCGLGTLAKEFLYDLPLFVTTILGFFLIDVATTVSPIFNFSCPENHITGWVSWFGLFVYVLIVTVFDQEIIKAVFGFVFFIILELIFLFQLPQQLQALITSDR
jgi:Pentapeptide repeats (8 copies)